MKHLAGAIYIWKFRFAAESRVSGLICERKKEEILSW
jgi:hypothetical protein